MTAEGVQLKYSVNSTYYLVERSNWSKYINGKYIGLTHRETRANVSAISSNDKGVKFSGFFYRLEETLRDMTKSSQSIDEMVMSEFVVNPTGKMTFSKDEGFPQFRDFPVYPVTEVKPGDRWQYEGMRSVDPKNDGKRSLLPILVEYTFIGAEKYRDEDVFRIRAKYATRMNKYRKIKSDDPNLENAEGTHDADILVKADTGGVVLIIERLDETFFYTDGTSIRFKGNTALFTETPVLMARETIIPEMKKIAESIPEKQEKQTPPIEDSFASVPGTASTSTIAPTPTPTPTPTKKELETTSTDNGGEEAFKVEDTPRGIRLSVRDLRFAADSDTILSSEIWRLDAIAKTLLLAPQGHFLVEGHTASVGKASGEQDLSVRRAKKIVDELTKRGLRAEQFIYSGYGGTRPVADNATSEGRALNRRVEITIME
jgi:outer membrane protein OmpA-like peptidoglycan-associated protein